MMWRHMKTIYIQADSTVRVCSTVPCSEMVPWDVELVFAYSLLAKSQWKTLNQDLHPKSLISLRRSLEQETCVTGDFCDRGPGLNPWQVSRSFVHLRWKLAGDSEINHWDGTFVCVASARGVTFFNKKKGAEAKQSCGFFLPEGSESVESPSTLTPPTPATCRSKSAT